MQKETKDKLRKMLEKAVADRELAGGCLLVRQHDEECCYLEAGMADVEVGKPIQRDQIYRLYSMSKPITGAAAMKLFEDGALDLGQSVSAYLPSFQDQLVEQDGRLVKADRQVQVRDLLNMSSGLVYNGETGFSGRHADMVFRELMERLFTDHPMTTKEFAVRMGEGPLLFQPGSSWKYGSGADVLGAVIEAAAGMPLGEYLEKNFFLPLGMEDTGFFVPEKKKDRLVTAYQADGKGALAPYRENHLGIINAMDRKPAFESGGAGLVSTIDDFARFAQMLLNGGELDGVRVLKPQTVRFMTSGALNGTQKEAFERNFPTMPGYDYGNLVRVMKEPGRSCTLNNAGEYGWDGWLGCYFANDPAADMTILFMMQMTDSGLTPLVRRLRNVIMSE
ncbi:MAG TPA: beta-lactamase family protein [Candidatus Eisenbergiella merdipullorum]|uniref:Beta-lactamase family protein n=1 Tax=Candidatus Eisenbergiella merdipullorum TaxID=2838553 RepID=A0A9D2I5N0_9FIRM|nr:beta-lactamase family protein [Candidatus Eisenbergiella merdipullorum]